MRPFLHTLRESEDGQAVVELALVLPVLLLVVLGIVDFGRAVNYWNDETHLANVAARYAAVGGTGGTCKGTDYSTGHTLTEYVLCEAGVDSSELQNGSSGTGTSGVHGGKGTPSGGVTVCVSVPNATVGSPVEVKITAKYTWLPFFKFATNPTTTLAGTATMRLEQVPPSSLGYQTAPC
jgi:Flp pilus assembly protein TadG